MLNIKKIGLLGLLAAACTLASAHPGDREYWAQPYPPSVRAPEVQIYVEPPHNRYYEPVRPRGYEGREAFPQNEQRFENTDRIVCLDAYNRLNEIVSRKNTQYWFAYQRGEIDYQNMAFHQERNLRVTSRTREELRRLSYDGDAIMCNQIAGQASMYVK